MWLVSRRAKRETLLLVDAGSGSVGAAYLSYGGAGTPALHHAVRIPISDSEDATAALSEAVRRVVIEGAPLLREATGIGRASRAIVAIASPWQELRVISASRTADEPFTFTRGVLSDLAHGASDPGMGFVPLLSSVMATMLNGYLVEKPLGKRARSAQVVVASSFAEARLRDHALRALRETARIGDATFVSFPWLAYETVRELYPHEQDYLIIDAAGRATDVLLIARGCLAGSASGAAGVRSLLKPQRKGHEGAVESGVRVLRDLSAAGAYEKGKEAWLASMVGALGSLAKSHALPRTAFLLADPEAGAFVKSLLADDARVRSLWLTNEPMRVIPVMPGQLSKRVAAESQDANDLFLLLLAHHAALSTRPDAPL